VQQATDFTVIIPTKARPALLERALRTVLAQTYPSFKVIVVDDGDGEGLEVAARLGDRRIAATSSDRAGQVAARKLGVTLAIGRWITFLDDDDWWEGQGHLRALADVLERTPGGQPVLAYGSGVMVEEGTGARLPFEARADWQSIRHDNTILVSSMAYPLPLHAQLGTFDAALPYYWDWDWYLRLAAAKVPFEVAGSAAARITCHPGNVSSDARAAERQANLETMRLKHGLGELKLKNHLSIAIERQG